MNTKKIIRLIPILLLSGIVSCKAMNQVTSNLSGGGTGDGSLTEREVVSGLKEALRIGAENAASSASRKNGFLRNPRIKIPFPPEARKVKKKALKLGLDRQVNKFVTTLNRAAEKAAKKAAPVFVDAIRNMTVRDAFDILHGSERAATNYLRRTTSAELKRKFTPIVERATDRVHLTRYWSPLIKKYNMAAKFTGDEEINPDLDEYVTNRAMDGLFKLIAGEEVKIRKNPVARTTELLRKVFGRQD